MRGFGSAVRLAIAVTWIVACREDGSTSPEDHQPSSAKAGTLPGVPPDTTRPLPGSVRAYGQVLAVSTSAVSQGSSDTLHFTPVPGVAIKIWRNVLVDGEARQVLAAETISGTNGEYSVSGLAGGYYIVKVTVPVGSPWADNWSYLPATSAEVKVDVYLWRKQ